MANYRIRSIRVSPLRAYQHSNPAVVNVENALLLRQIVNTAIAKGEAELYIKAQVTGGIMSCCGTTLVTTVFRHLGKRALKAQQPHAELSVLRSISARSSSQSSCSNSSYSSSTAMALGNNIARSPPS